MWMALIPCHQISHLFHSLVVLNQAVDNKTGIIARKNNPHQLTLLLYMFFCYISHTSKTRKSVLCACMK